MWKSSQILREEYFGAKNAEGIHRANTASGIMQILENSNPLSYITLQRRMDLHGCYSMHDSTRFRKDVEFNRFSRNKTISSREFGGKSKKTKESKGWRLGTGITKGVNWKERGRLSVESLMRGKIKWFDE